jgi:AbrB family looped-hinge helix DNA binding protein
LTSKNKAASQKEFHMPSTKVGRWGRIALPKEIRRKIRVEEGEQVIIKPVTQTLLDLRGSIPVSGEQDFDAIRKEVITGKNGITVEPPENM